LDWLAITHITEATKIIRAGRKYQEIDGIVAIKKSSRVVEQMG